MSEVGPAEPEVLDITVRIAADMPVWPGDPPPQRTLTSSMAAGSECNLSAIAMSAHTGTHLDAPCHFVADGAPMDHLPVGPLVGPARVVEIPHDGHVTAGDLDAAQIEPHTVRLLFRTRNSRERLLSRSEFYTGFAAVTPDAARWLVDHGVRLVGVDYLSVEAYHAPGHPTHGILLGAGVLVLEGCDLSEVPPGSYTLFCGPLLLAGSDGAPARALLIDDARVR